MAGAFAAQVPVDARALAIYGVQGQVLLAVSWVLSVTAKRLMMLAGAYLLLGTIVIQGLASNSRAMALVLAEAEMFLLLPMAGLSLLLWRRLRPLLIALIAAVLYVGIMVGIGFSLAAAGLDAGRAGWWAWGLGGVSLVLGITVFGWLLGRQSVRWPVVGLTSVGIAGIAVELLWEPDLPIGPILVGVPSHVLQVWLVWLAFRATVSLQDRRVLSSLVIHSHLAFGFIATYYTLLVLLADNAGLFELPMWPVASISAGFAGYVLVLHILLRRIWRERETAPGRRLMFLRAFGSTRGPERLLDSLEDTWQRVGRIDLIGASDLALRTIGSRMIEAFLLRRIGTQFLRTEQHVNQRLGQLRSSLEGDARYPVNEIYCHGNTWQRAVRQLAPASDAILMDLRGFTSSNHGCVFELSELVHSVPLARVVLLADHTTDLPTVEEVAFKAWAELSAASSSVDDAPPQLNVLLCARSRTHDAEALFGLLLEAAVDTRHQRLAGISPGRPESRPTLAGS